MPATEDLHMKFVGNGFMVTQKISQLEFRKVGWGNGREMALWLSQEQANQRSAISLELLGLICFGGLYICPQ